MPRAPSSGRPRLAIIVVAFVRSGLRAGSAPREVCESLLDACLSPDPKGTRYAGCDNMTVVLVLLDGWESALATKAYTPALTFSGGRIGSVGEAAAAMSATLPKMPRPLNNARPPLPAEFRAAMSAGTTAPAPKSESDSQAAQEAGAANREKPAESAPEAGPPSGDGNAGQRNATVGATDSGATMGWTQRRIAEGKVAPPRTAHGIEFALASFSAPFVAKAPAAGSRMSTGSINSRGVVTAATGASATAGDLATSAVAKQRKASRASSSSVPPNARRRNSNHLRSATAPMLPSPLWHHRQRREPPSEERIATAAAIAVLAEVGAAGAVAASALAEEKAVPPCQNSSANGRPAAEVDPTAEVRGRGKSGEEPGRQAPPSEDAGLVFVPVEPSVTPSEVTITATASPHHPT